jgi:hypothetical protein
MASKIQKFYDGRVVFLTGGSGFFGKVLLLKLLQSCPGIRGIIVLLREKHGQSCKERLFNILSSSVSATGFCFVPSEHPHLYDCFRSSVGSTNGEAEA